MAAPAPRAKNHPMFIRPPAQPRRQTWLWFAPYAAIGIFAVAMLVVTGAMAAAACQALQAAQRWLQRHRGYSGGPAR